MATTVRTLVPIQIGKLLNATGNGIYTDGVKLYIVSSVVATLLELEVPTIRPTNLISTFIINDSDPVTLTEARQLVEEAFTDVIDQMETRFDKKITPVIGDYCITTDKLDKIKASDIYKVTANPSAGMLEISNIRGTKVVSEEYLAKVILNLATDVGADLVAIEQTP